ncbi:MAG: bifunctional 4-hydroxy-2-oxoglutarate aldolase/2-dehydro-3-deoxy-phosphogluconate aldolase [Verrucomicrobia bacterium]|nr:bifunctional 4-hydroxy-2-oxoglutarate aldolase/2-dehydro-3-deoxy-phosphogluconate aldolase [Verrucomicrobiota bacterium]
MNEIMDFVRSGRIIAILRGDFGGREEEMTAILSETGITAVEVTLNSPGALNSIKRLAVQFGSRLAVGAGTVLLPDEAARAADAGAQFIVSPNRDVRVIAATKARRLASFPGCFTPSEVVEALQAGADAAKIFPAESLGPGFVKAMRGPLPEVRLIPTGGVTPETARTYLAAGAWAVGVGSELIGKDVQAHGWQERLRERARGFVAAARGKG